MALQLGWFFLFFIRLIRLAESIYGGSFGHLGPGNGYGEWALPTRESGFYRRSGVLRAWEVGELTGYTPLCL